MAGEVKRILDQIIQIRGAGNTIREGSTRTKLILKGLDPIKFTASSNDPPELIVKAKQVATELGVTVRI